MHRAAGILSLARHAVFSCSTRYVPSRLRRKAPQSSCTYRRTASYSDKARHRPRRSRRLQSLPSLLHRPDPVFRRASVSPAAVARNCAPLGSWTVLKTSSKRMDSARRSRANVCSITVHMRSLLCVSMTFGRTWPVSSRISQICACGARATRKTHIRPVFLAKGRQQLSIHNLRVCPPVPAHAPASSQVDDELNRG